MQSTLPVHSEYLMFLFILEGGDFTTYSIGHLQLTMMRELPFLDRTLSSELSDNDSHDSDRSQFVDKESQMGFDEPFLGRNSSLVVSHLNIRSVVSKHDDLRVLEKRNVAHVIGLSESWFNSNVSDGVMQVSGFNLHRKDRNR